MAKQLFGVNIAYNALMDGFNVCYISLEIPKSHIMYNLLSRHSNEIKSVKPIPHLSLKQGILTEEEEKNCFTLVLNDLSKLKGKVYITDGSEVFFDSPEELKYQLKIIQDEFRKKYGDFDLLILDYLQIAKFNTSGNNDEKKAMNEIVSFLTKQSINFLDENREICVLLLSQTNREGFDYAKSHAGNYLSRHAAESNEIERSSNKLISIYTDDLLANTLEAKIQLVKSRDTGGMVDSVGVYYDPKYYVVGDIVKTVDMSSVSTNTLMDTSNDDNSNIVSSLSKLDAESILNM